MKPYNDALHAIVKEVVGYLDDDFNDKPCGSKECAIGDFIADSFLYTVSPLSFDKS